MHVINEPRLAGKTTRCLNIMCNNPNAVMLCHTIAERDRVRRMVVENPDVSNRIFEVQEYLQLHMPTSRTKIMIDNADLLLERMLGLKIDTITVSDE